MRILLKIFKWFFIAIVSLILTVTAVFYIKNKMFLESSEDSFVSYLQSNKVDLKNIITSGDVSQNLLTEEEYTHQVFLLGEVHGFAEVQKLDKFFVMHLNKKLGVRHYVGE